MVALILIAAFVFQPIRNWIQEQLDRYYFYKDRYDYRRTLIEFARELGSPTDLDEMLESVADRLIRTLGIRHVAFFVWDEARSEVSTGAGQQPPRPADRKRSLRSGSEFPESAIPASRTCSSSARATRWTWCRTRCRPSVRRSIAELELTYYLPCSARGRTIAYLGVSRTETGDFLSSDDVELLVTLSGYVGIAVDNAMLYRSLARKVGRVRAAEGILRKHRRIDQRRNSGGGSGRPRGELELADRKAHRDFARDDARGPASCGELLPAGSCAISWTARAAKPASTTSTSSCCGRTGLATRR